MAEEEPKLGVLKIDKNEAKGICLTCRRGLFTFYQVWCMHPKLPSGYKAHSPFDTCPGYELSGEFKLLERILTVQRNQKFVEPHVKETKHGEVEIHAKNRIINGKCEASSGPESNQVPANNQSNVKCKERLEEKS